MTASKIRCSSDGNELQYVRSFKSGKALMHEYVYTKAKYKKGQQLLITDDELNKMIWREVFKEVENKEE